MRLEGPHDLVELPLSWIRVEPWAQACLTPKLSLALPDVEVSWEFELIGDNPQNYVEQASLIPFYELSISWTSHGTWSLEYSHNKSSLTEDLLGLSRTPHAWLEGVSVA